MLLPVQNIKKYFTGFSWDGKAAGLGLGFGFVVKAVFTVLWLWLNGACTELRFLCFSCCPDSEQAGGGHKSERIQTEQLTLTGQRDTPYHI